MTRDECGSGSGADPGSAARLVAALGAALDQDGAQRRELLASVVAVARAVFGAAAASVLLLDEPGAELVFEATVGAGDPALVGRRFPSDQGIAGWVVAAGEPLIVDDLSRNPLFAREIARQTLYIPEALMAAPVARGGVVLGVLEVLDPAVQSRSSLGDLELLGLLAAQAAIALDGSAHRAAATRARAALAGGDTEPLAGILRLVFGWDQAHQAAGLRMLQALAGALESA